jgi:hypothetical protein
MMNEIAPFNRRVNVFVNNITSRTIKIYNPSLEQIEAFRREFQKTVLEQIVFNESTVVASSSHNRPTPNISTALINSGISITGSLPKDTGYSSGIILDDETATIYSAIILPIVKGDSKKAQDTLNLLLQSNPTKKYPSGE